MALTYDLAVKTAPAQWIVSIREIIPSYQDVGALCAKVAELLGPAMAGSVMPFAIWHDPEYKPRDVDAEAGFYFEREVQSPAGTNVHQLPETLVASTIHRGAYRQLPETYNAAVRWVNENGYKVAGPFRELYLHVTSPVRQDDESYVTEIQIPVERA